LLLAKNIGIIVLVFLFLVEGFIMDQDHGDKKPYEKPDIIYEADLEVRAGSPLSPSDDLLNPLDG
jgi:hypothetical protein